MKVILALSIVLAVALATDASRDRNNKPYKVVCYWGSWSAYGSVEGKFQAEDINPHICTHLNYAFASLKNNKIAFFDENIDHDMIPRFNKLRHDNPHLTTLISIGGWSDGSGKYSAMVSNAQHRAEFVHSVVDFLKKYDFDGLDIDWEYPGFTGEAGGDRQHGRAQDKADFVTLLKELRKAFAPDGFILTAAVGAGEDTIKQAYDVKGLSTELDFVNFMTYDFHGGYEKVVGHNAPLHAEPHGRQEEKEFNIEYVVDYWLKQGGDPKKLVLGMPLYGRGYTLAKGSNGAIGSPADSSVGNEDEMGYNIICAMTKSSWEKKWNEDQKVPYAVHASQWIGYDDPKSIEEKVKFLKAKGLGGGMVWSVESDDYEGMCGQGKFPLIKTISRLLNNVEGPDVPSRSPLVTIDPGKIHCTKAGFFANANEQNKFHQCVDFGSGRFHSVEFHCPHGTTFHANNQTCA